MKKQISILILSGALLLSGCSYLCESTAGAPVKNECGAVKGKIVLDTTSRFAFDSAALGAKDKDQLKAVAKRLKATPAEKVRINGYTDNTGPDAYNLDLSQRRAKAVAGYLAEQGIDAKRISAFGLGATDFVASNETAAGRGKNRRTEILFYE